MKLQAGCHLGMHAKDGVRHMAFTGIRQSLGMPDEIPLPALLRSMSSWMRRSRNDNKHEDKKLLQPDAGRLATTPLALSSMSWTVSTRTGISDSHRAHRQTYAPSLRRVRSSRTAQSCLHGLTPLLPMIGSRTMTDGQAQRSKSTCMGRPIRTAIGARSGRCL